MDVKWDCTVLTMDECQTIITDLCTTYSVMSLCVFFLNVIVMANNK